MQYVKVADNPDLVRDISSHGVLSINREALSAYKQRRDKALQLELFFKEFEDMKVDIQKLKEQLSSITISNMRF